MVRVEALDWLESAIVDLDEARKAFERGSYHLSVFLSHQAVEKALKAYIVEHVRQRPPRTHDLVELLHLSGLKLEAMDEELISELSPYYTIARYPNAGLRKPWREIAQGTARKFLDVAERVVDKVRGLMEPTR